MHVVINNVLCLCSTTCVQHAQRSACGLTLPTEARIPLRKTSCRMHQGRTFSKGMKRPPKCLSVHMTSTLGPVLPRAKDTSCRITYKTAHLFNRALTCVQLIVHRPCVCPADERAEVAAAHFRNTLVLLQSEHERATGLHLEVTPSLCYDIQGSVSMCASCIPVRNKHYVCHRSFRLLALLTCNQHYRYKICTLPVVIRVLLGHVYMNRQSISECTPWNEAHFNAVSTLPVMMRFCWGYVKTKE